MNSTSDGTAKREVANEHAPPSIHNDNSNMELPQLPQSYWGILRTSPGYRYLWIAFVISNLGDFFTFVATITTAQRYSQAVFAVSALLIARVIPPFVLSPLAGVLSDRFDRRIIMLLADVARMLLVLCFVAVRSPSTLWVLYVVIILQYAVSGIWEPSRSAILPSLVRRVDIVVVNAMDSTTWSATCAIGSALGGITAAYAGTTVCYIIDSFSYLLSGVFIVLLIRAGKNNKYTIVGAVSGAATADEEAQSSNPQNVASEDGSVDVTQGSWWFMFKNGMKYLWTHKDYLIVSHVKASLAFIWGAVDLISIKYSSVMSINGSAALTLGLLFAVIGVGTLIGPLIAIRYSDQNSALSLRRWLVAAFAPVAMGVWIGGAWAPNVVVFYFGLGLLRPFGEAQGFVFSGTILQSSVDYRVRGRVLAWEGGLRMVGEAMGSFSCAVMFDYAHLPAHSIGIIWAVITSVIAALWIGVYYPWFAKREFPRLEEEKKHTAPLLLENGSEVELVDLL